MSGFENLKRQTLSDSVYEQLREAILAGNIPDGEELNQVTLAKQFDVSRVPVREALRRLQAEQLVTATPYQQYMVSSVSPESLLELIDLREELEAFAVRRHIAQVTPETIELARSMNAELRRTHDGPAWLTGDVELHVLLDGPGTQVARMVRDLRGRVHRYLRSMAGTQKRRKLACSEHDRIIEAIARKDADAAEVAMREHVATTRTMIASWLDDHVDEEGAVVP